MDTDRSDIRVLQAPLAELERVLIETFVHARGFDAATLAKLSGRERDALFKEASVFASAKLAEIEARWHYLHELHE